MPRWSFPLLVLLRVSPRFHAVLTILQSAVCLALVTGLAASPPPGVPRAKPAAVNMDEAKLAEIDTAVAKAIAEKKLPGCVVAIGHRSRLVLLKAYGHRQIEPRRVPMTVDTLFDLASVTKPVATATSIMMLVKQGRVDLDAPVARYLPEFGQNGKQKITVRQLLTHQGGLVPDNPMSDYAQGPDEARRRIFALRPTSPPGEKFAYSDVGFLVLGELVHRVSGRDLNAFSHEHIFAPLGMRDTSYLPRPPLTRRAAVTERRKGHWMQGEVHDPRAYALGGVAGHAGLFSTAQDLARYAQMMLEQGQYRGVRLLQPETVNEMTAPYPVTGGFRGLGWDRLTDYSTNRGKTFSPRAFGHGGFTGTSLWIDPGLELFVIFLSNRVHPDGRGSVNPLAGQIGTIAADAIVGLAKHALPTPAAKPRVMTGIDVLRRDGFRRLAGRRVGLITNQTGVARDGTSTIRLLAKAPGTTLVALFSPEHGLEGKLDVARIGDTRDKPSGLPVHSLYGESRKPTPKSLEGIDTLVFDIQDVGCRFYTYVSTMRLAMEAAAEQKIRFVVLDRPNPLGGLRVSGPILDPGRESFVAPARLPIQHGMTAGELARLFASEMNFKLDLEVIPMEGWRRSDDYEATGLPWINPSPNMRSPIEAFLYPGIGLLERTNVSVGRGTRMPFELVGAPWLDGQRLTDALVEADLPGVRFTPVAFRPEAAPFAGEICGGVEISLVDRRTFDSVRTGLEIARALHRLYPTQWETAHYDALLGSRKTFEAVLAGKPLAEIEALWQDAFRSFFSRRAKYLLYK